MVKVCHVTSVHSSRDVRIFYKMCTSLANNGYDVYHVAPGENREENGVKVVGIGEIPTSRRQRMGAFAKKAYMAALNIDADIYHLHDPELLPYAVKLKKAGKIVVFDSHEFYGLQILEKKWIPSIFRNLISNIYMKYEERACKKIDAVVCVCTINGKNYFENRTNKTVFITNAPLVSEMIMGDSKKENGNSICYVGGLTEARGITNIVKAAHKAGVKLYLAGSFANKAYEKQLRQMEEWQSVEYLGFLNRTEIAALYENVAIGMCVLKDEGQYHKIDTFPVKIYEYMSAGVPVVAHDCRYLRETIHNANIGICVPADDIEAIALAIGEIGGNMEKAKCMGENGRKAVLEKYNWNIEEQKLLSLYKQLIDERI